MKTTDCRHTRREIDSNELNQRLSDHSLAHLSGCGPCRELLDRTSTLRSLVSSLGTVSAPPDFDMRLRARLAAEKRPKVTWVSFLRQAPGVPAIALAFSLLVIITLAVFMRSPSTPEIAVTPQGAAPAVAITKPATVDLRPIENSNDTVKVNQPETTDRPSGPRRTTKPHAQLASDSRDSGLPSREYSVSPAATVNGNNAANSHFMSPVVSLSAPAQAVVVSLRDNNGATRTISLPPVSFGSQRLGYQSETLASSGKGAW